MALKRGQQVIVDQIKDREIERLRQEEILEKEKIQMLKMLEKNKEEDRKTAESKKQRVKIMMDEVKVSN